MAYWINSEWTAERIKALRKHIGYTQRDLAEELNVRQPTVADWETGKRHVTKQGPYARLLSMIAEQEEFQFDDLPEKNDLPALV